MQMILSRFSYLTYFQVQIDVAFQIYNVKDGALQSRMAG